MDDDGCGPKHSAGQTTSFFTDEDSDYCVDCGKAVLSSQQGLKCDCCGFWHHAKCEKIGDDIYGFLQQHSDETTLMWYCRKCVVTTRKMMSTVGEVRECQRQMEDKMSEMVKSMNKKIDDLTSEMNKKLDSKCTELDKVDSIMKRLDKERAETAVVQETVSTAVKEQLQDDRREEEEMDKRKTSLIIHGLEESSLEEAGDRNREDTRRITSMLHDLKCDDVKTEKLIRLGKRPVAGNGVKPRPLKVVMATEECKRKLLSEAKNLKSLKEGGWSSIFIHQDLTPRQRQERKLLVEQLKSRQAAGEKDLIIVGNKLVKRRYDKQTPNSTGN